MGLVASFLVADHGLGSGTLDAGGDARPITDRARLPDRVHPYEIQYARDAGAPHLCALATERPILSLLQPAEHGALETTAVRPRELGDHHDHHVTLFTQYVDRHIVSVAANANVEDGIPDP